MKGGIMIEVRVWDGLDMRYSPPLGEWDFADCRLFLEYNRKHPIMLFTGKEDTKKRKIYAGDILYFSTYKVRGEVEWSEDYLGWWVRLLDQPADKRQYESLFNLTTSIGWADSYEVVGHIYEGRYL
jgi:hypothetical protein